MAGDKVTVNRAPVLTLWAAVVAERLGFDEEAALTLGKALAGLNAQSKGRSLGLYRPAAGAGERPPPTSGLGEEFWVDLCGRGVPAKTTEAGVRAVEGDKPIEPGSVRRYLDGKFGEALPAVREAMQELAAAYDQDTLAEVAFGLYEQFRPTVAKGRRGWGQAGTLDLALIRSLGPKAGQPAGGRTTHTLDK